MSKENRLMTLPKVAKALGLTAYAVHEAVRRGELVAVRPNPHGHQLIEPKELARWATSIGLQGPDPGANMNPTERLVEHDAEVAEACASGREELARDLMGLLERGCDRFEPKLSRQIRQTLERLLD